MEQKKTLIQILGYAGLIPFIALPLWVFLSQSEIGILWHQYYAAIILSFMGGIHWGLAIAHIKFHAFKDTTALVLSIVVALIAWASLLIGTSFVYPALILGFAFVRAVDICLELPAWYGRLRTHLTIIVIICLLFGWYL